MTIEERQVLPYVKGSETSKAAAESMVQHAPSIERQLLVMFIASGAEGWTDDELENVTKRSHQTVSARRRGLEKKGVIYATGMKRKTRSGRSAMVYAIDPFISPAEIESRMKAKQTGRPKSDNPRNSRITICFNAEEMKHVKHAADVEMVTVAQLVRKSVIQYLCTQHEVDRKCLQESSEIS